MLTYTHARPVLKVIDAQCPFNQIDTLKMPIFNRTQQKKDTKIVDACWYPWTRSEWLLLLLLSSIVGGLMRLLRRWRRNRRRAMVTPQTNRVHGRASSRDIVRPLENLFLI